MIRFPRRPVRSAALLAAAILAGCGGSRTETVGLAPEDGYPPAFVDDRPLIAQITALTVEPTAGGIIIRAEGLPPTQGYWDPDLVNITGDDSPAGTLVYEFHVRPPVAPEPAGTERSRRIAAAAYANNLELQGIRTVTVAGAQNSRSARR